jgi:hypothetical protein
VPLRTLQAGHDLVECALALFVGFASRRNGDLDARDLGELLSDHPFAV